MQNLRNTHAAGETFRPPKSDLVTLLLCLPLFIGMVVANCVLGFTTPFWGIAIAGNVVFGGMALLVLYGIVSWRRYRLVIDERGVVEYGVFTRKEILFADVTEAAWSEIISVHGSLLLRTPDAKLRITFGGYKNDAALRLVCLLHAALPENVQRNWPMYCLRHAMPLRESKDEPHREPKPDEIRETRKRWNYIFAVSIPFFCAAAVFMWWAETSGFWFVPLAPLTLWIILYLYTPREGHLSKRAVGVPGMMVVISALFLLPAGGLFLLYLLRRANIGEAWEMGILLFCGAITLGYALFRAFRADRERYGRDLEAAPGVVEEWEAWQREEVSLER